MARPVTLHPLGGLDDATREIVCTVTIDGRVWRAAGTLIERAGGPVVVLQLRPTSSDVVVDHMDREVRS